MLGRYSGRQSSGYDIEEALKEFKDHEGFLKVRSGCYMFMHMSSIEVV